MLKADSTMTKVEAMDYYFDSFKKKIDGSEICRVVNELFGINLEAILVLTRENVAPIDASSSSRFITSPSRAAIDSYLNKNNMNISGTAIRKMINEIFGVNLDGISKLEKSRISLFSKGQWVIHNENDLFVVRTGTKDVDVSVFPTEYFLERTGSKELPFDLQESLINMGFSYIEELNSYYFFNPTGESVPDQFKGQTLGAIMKVTHEWSSMI